MTGDDRHLRTALPEIGAEGVSEGAGRWRIVLPPEVEVEAVWELAARQNLLVRKLTHRRDTLEEIFLKAMGHLSHTPRDSFQLSAADWTPSAGGPAADRWLFTNGDISATRDRSRDDGRGSWSFLVMPGAGCIRSGWSCCSRWRRSSGPSCAPASSISPITWSCCRGSNQNFASSSRSTAGSSRSSCTSRGRALSSSRRWPGPAFSRRTSRTTRCHSISAGPSRAGATPWRG